MTTAIQSSITIRARQLQGDQYTLIQTSQDLSALLDYLGIHDDDITGAIVKIGDGDYDEVWLTEDSRYYDLDAIYHDENYYK